jgi:hypothetical protein
MSAGVLHSNRAAFAHIFVVRPGHVNKMPYNYRMGVLDSITVRLRHVRQNLGPYTYHIV